MYQSLHTTLIGPGGKPIEIQIRTEEMDLIAEQGIAAHWGYKKASAQDMGKENKWLTQFLEWQQDLTDSHEFMEYFRGDLVSGEIYVFTPTGDLMQLPRGPRPWISPSPSIPRSACIASGPRWTATWCPCTGN